MTASVLWLAVAWLTTGQTLVGQFDTERDCRVAVAYAQFQTYVIHATECQRVAPLEPLRGVRSDDPPAGGYDGM